MKGVAERKGEFVATFVSKDRVRLPESMTFAQAGMEICGYVKKYGECVKIERVSVYG